MPLPNRTSRILPKLNLQNYFFSNGNPIFYQNNLRRYWGNWYDPKKTEKPKSISRKYCIKNIQKCAKYAKKYVKNRNALTVILRNNFASYILRNLRSSNVRLKLGFTVLWRPIVGDKFLNTFFVLKWLLNWILFMF